MKDLLPPHSIESEQAVIGCCLLSPVDCLPDCQSVLSVNSFYDHRNKTIWPVICSIPADQMDVIVLRQKLKDAGKLIECGGESYLNECAQIVPSTANLPAWLDTLRQKEILRRIISTCTAAIQSAYASNGNSDDLLDALERDILKIRPEQKQPNDIKELVRLAIEKIELRLTKPGALTGLSTGLIDVDRLTDGMHKGEMIVLAGFPSTGKTALAVNMTLHNALKNIPCAIFSAEMRPVQLVVRSICSESKINFYRLKETDVPIMKGTAIKLSTAPLYIEQASRLSVMQVSAVARRLKQKFDIQMVAVDYIQLLTGIGDNREQEISSISKGLKALSLELDVPVIALSQLTDDGKLRESRAIGQDADSVWKLENDGDWQSLIQPVKLNVEKCREGATGKIPLTFMKEYTKFENAEKENE